MCLYQRYLSLKIEQLSEVFFGIDEQELKKIKIEIKIKFLFFIFLRELYAYKFDDIAKVLKQNNIKILDITTEDGNLEDVFVQLTNH